MMKPVNQYFSDANMEAWQKKLNAEVDQANA